jgi:hypothetical protein
MGVSSSASDRHHYVIVRKLPESYFQDATVTTLAVQETALNTQDFILVRLSTVTALAVQETALNTQDFSLVRLST